MTTKGSWVRNPGLGLAATFRRQIAGSLDRVWENVFDWEHLPWLHATTFRSIELVAEDRYGWRARVGFARGGESEIELVADRSEGRYVVRTLAGAGVGTEIWTSLSGDAQREVLVAIEFLLPAALRAHYDAIGRGYVELYARLWDEDERMIQARAAALARRRIGADPAAIERLDLGPESSLRARLPLEFELAGERFRLIEVAGELVVDAAECPHRFGPLERSEDEPETLFCPWHGYRFDRGSGAECAGRRLRLPQRPRLERNPATGSIVAVADRGAREMRGLSAGAAPEA